MLNVGVQGEAIINVPFVAAGDLREPRLPDIENWLTAFWIATFKRLNRSSRPTFLRPPSKRYQEEVVPVEEAYHQGSYWVKINYKREDNGEAFRVSISSTIVNAMTLTPTVMMSPVH